MPVINKINKTFMIILIIQQEWSNILRFPQRGKFSLLKRIQWPLGMLVLLLKKSEDKDGPNNFDD